MQTAAAIITAAFALCGTALTVFWGNKKGEKNTDVIIFRLKSLESRVDAVYNYLFETKGKGQEIIKPHLYVR